MDEQPVTLLVIVGDSPRQPSGLGRIARDLGDMVAGTLTRLPATPEVHAFQIGWEDLSADLSLAHSLPFAPLPNLGRDWGAAQVGWAVQQWQAAFRATRVILWIVWDPARGFAYLDLARAHGWELWAYTAIDGENPQGKIGGPAREYCAQVDRLLAYGAYGARVLRASLDGSVSWLPHGHHWSPDVVQAWADTPPTPDAPVLGCVATNQPRKDLGLYCATLAALRRRNARWRGWLHTDQLVTAAWSLPELIDLYQLEDALTLTGLDGQVLAEGDLIAAYTRCTITLAPGRGEGFGYPILESLACGIPTIHTYYGGGADLLPRAWCYTPQDFDYTNPYVIGRPLHHPTQVLAAIENLQRTWRQAPLPLRHYCRALAEPYHWRQIADRWQGWIAQGLQRPPLPRT